MEKAFSRDEAKIGLREVPRHPNINKFYFDLFENFDFFNSFNFLIFLKFQIFVFLSKF
jgi:hypothetical protein